MKDTKHIRQDFYSVAWVIPKGLDWGLLRGQLILSVHMSVMLSPPKPFDQIRPNLVCELHTCMGHAPPQDVFFLNFN